MIGLVRYFACMINQWSNFKVWNMYKSLTLTKIIWLAVCINSYWINEFATKGHIFVNHVHDGNKKKINHPNYEQKRKDL